MLMTHAIVRHKKYGKGTVISQDDALIDIRFEGSSRAISFVYPDAFDSYLSLEDAELSAAIAQELEAQRQQLLAEREEQQLSRKAEAEEALAREKELAKQKRRDAKAAAPKKSKADKVKA